MSNDLRNAVSFIVDAGKAIKDRSEKHGHTENSFRMIGEMWTTYLQHVFACQGDVIDIKPPNVARMMEMVKIARATYGDPENRENTTDSIGYAALAGMLQIPNHPFQPVNVDQLAEALREELDNGEQKPVQ